MTNIHAVNERGISGSQYPKDRNRHFLDCVSVLKTMEPVYKCIGYCGRAVALLLRTEEFGSKFGRQSNNMTNIPLAFPQLPYTNAWIMNTLRQEFKHFPIIQAFSQDSCSPTTDRKQVPFRGSKNIRDYSTKCSHHGDLTLRNLANFCCDLSHIIYNLSSTNHSHSQSIDMESLQK